MNEAAIVAVQGVVVLSLIALVVAVIMLGISIYRLAKAFRDNGGQE